MRQGRPLRFLAVVLGGWTAARVALLWPAAVEAVAGGRAVVRAEAASAPVREVAAIVGAGVARPSGHVAAPVVSIAGMIAAEPVPHLFPRAVPTVAVAAVEVRAFVPVPESDTPAPATAAQSEATVATDRGTSRLAGSFWLVGRPDGGRNLAFGQLGASQAGLRLTYALGDARRIALSARVSAPLSGRGREGAVGVDWRPTALPVHLLVEERVPLDGGPARPAAQLIAGVDRRLPLGFRLDAYGQAGGVYRRGGFADGAVRIARPLLARVDLGAGAWGAAQRGVARVDLGPTLGVAVPVSGVAVRLGVDYRVRVAGAARPGSGPAVTLGGSF